MNTIQRSINQQLASGTRDRNLYIVALYEMSSDISGADVVQMLKERGINLSRQRVMAIVKRYYTQKGLPKPLEVL
jgi:hypothetical protein